MVKHPMQLSAEAYEAIRNHILTEYPNEACGLMIAGKYYSCTNTAADPTHSFQIDAEELLMKEIQHGQIEAVIHSHPYSLLMSPAYPAVWPSASDMEQWMRGSVPWVIFATEGENISEPAILDDSFTPPLEGRQFVHGITDCYAMIRDYYKLERGITLPDYPRDMSWWASGQDLYSENFKHAGFVEIKPDQATAGDVMLLRYRSSVINHGVVIASDSEVWSHIYPRLSGKADRHRYSRLADKYLRYVGPDAASGD